MKIISLSIAALIALSANSIALAETYKTDKNQVVVTGLDTKKKYEITTINTKGKPGKRNQETNGCGELLIDKGVKYKSLTVAGQSIDPATLSLKKHDRCQPKKNKATNSPSESKNNKSVILTKPANSIEPKTTK
jgi:hypothetical protein